MRSDAFWQVWRTYDGQDARVGADYERDFTRCVEGSGALKPEQEVWDRVLVAPLDSKHKALWMALAAGDKKVLDFLADKGDKGSDVFKNAREGRATFTEWLSKRRQEGAVRVATQETGLLGNVVASQLARVFVAQPAQAQVLGARLRIIAASRMDMEVSPYQLRVSVQQLVGMLYEATWGPPTASLSAQVMEARSLKVMQTLDGGGDRWQGQRHTGRDAGHVAAEGRAG